MKLYTAQYKYSDDDRLDITVKGKNPISKIFAPTWKMVMGSKEGLIALVCFCLPDASCHRFLLAEYRVKLGADYLGERSL